MALNLVRDAHAALDSAFRTAYGLKPDEAPSPYRFIRAFERE